MCGLWLFAGRAGTESKKRAAVFFYLGHSHTPYPALPLRIMIPDDESPREQ